jgi:hypothetical protein
MEKNDTVRSGTHLQIEVAELFTVRMAFVPPFQAEIGTDQPAISHLELVETLKA